MTTIMTMTILRRRMGSSSSSSLLLERLTLQRNHGGGVVRSAVGNIRTLQHQRWRKSETLITTTTKTIMCVSSLSSSSQSTTFGASPPHLLYGTSFGSWRCCSHSQRRFYSYSSSSSAAAPTTAAAAASDSVTYESSTSSSSSSSSSSSPSSTLLLTPKMMMETLLPLEEGQPLDRIPVPIARLIQTYAAKSPTYVTLHELMRTGQEDDDEGEDYDDDDDNMNVSHGQHRRLHQHYHGWRGQQQHQQQHHLGSSGRKQQQQQHYQQPQPPYEQRQHQKNRNEWRKRIQSSENTLMQYASMLQRELPIRLGHCIVDLDRIPSIKNMPSIQIVKGIYVRSFLQLLDAISPSQNKHAEIAFGSLLQQLYIKHSTVLLQMAQGVHEYRSTIANTTTPTTTTTTTTSPSIFDRMKQDMSQKDHEDDDGHNNGDDDDCQAFLDRFYTSRVGIRVLAGQYLALREQLLDGRQRRRHDSSSGSRFHNRQRRQRRRPGTNIIDNDDMDDDDSDYDDDDDGVKGINSGYVGMICTKTSPYKVVQQATVDATRLCVDRYGVAPKVDISGRLDLTFCYIPSHAHYIILELLKNAMRATVDFYISNRTGMEDSKTTTTTTGLNDSNNNTKNVDDDDDNNDESEPRSVLNRHIQQRKPTMVASSTFYDDLPPVRVVIADSPNNEDVIIKVSDLGGGIPRSQMDNIWSYLYTTADRSVQDRVLKPSFAVSSNNNNNNNGKSTNTASSLTGTQSPTPSSAESYNSDTTDEDPVRAGAAALASSPILAGLGFGLPLSRAHARYFGGDLDLVSLHGYGTNAYCHLARLGSNTTIPTKKSTRPTTVPPSPTTKTFSTTDPIGSESAGSTTTTASSR